MSNTMKYVSKSGTIKFGNRTYTYGSNTGASTKEASATLVCGHSMNLAATIKVKAIAYGQTITKQKADAISGTSVSVTINNAFIVDNAIVIRDIRSAIGEYEVGSSIIYSTTVD